MIWPLAADVQAEPHGKPPERNRRPGQLQGLAKIPDLHYRAGLRRPDLSYELGDRVDFGPLDAVEQHHPLAVELALAGERSDARWIFVEMRPRQLHIGASQLGRLLRKKRIAFQENGGPRRARA